MRNILIFFIKLYYQLVPEENRRICIHKESCSKYVYRTAIEKGCVQAIGAFYKRSKSCNRSYQYYKSANGSLYIVTKDGQTLSENEINPIVLKGIQSIL